MSALLVFGLIGLGLLLAGCGGGTETTTVVKTETTTVVKTVTTNRSEHGGEDASGEGGAAADPSEEGPSSGSSSSKSPSSSSSEELGGPLNYVGTITGSGQGTSFTDRYRLGPLIYDNEGSPPEEVLAACNLDSPTVLAASVFARGTISISYTEGSLPKLIGIGPENIFLGEGIDAGVVAYRLGGEWLCRQEELPLWEYQSGESQTFPIWVIAEDAISNAQPRVTQAALDTWQFKFIGPPGFAGNDFSGPGAASCSGSDQLMLYARPPFTYSPPNSGWRITCTVPKS